MKQGKEEEKKKKEEKILTFTSSKSEADTQRKNAIWKSCHKYNQKDFFSNTP